MAWVRIESSVSRHRKFQQAGPAACWLWTCSLCYAQEGLTDGFIPFEALSYLGVKSPSKLASRLVKSQLWDVCEGGWRIHDYLEHNKAASEVRRVQVERRRAGSEGGKHSGHSRRSTDHVAEANPKQVASTDVKQPAKPSTSTATSTTTSTASAVTERPSRPMPIVARRRLDAAWEGPRVYVPHRVHMDLLALRNHTGAESELLKWYEAVSNDWTEGAHRSESPGADMFRFWKARYDEKWPPSGAKPSQPAGPAYVKASEHPYSLPAPPRTS